MATPVVILEEADPKVIPYQANVHRFDALEESCSLPKPFRFIEFVQSFDNRPVLILTESRQDIGRMDAALRRRQTNLPDTQKAQD